MLQRMYTVALLGVLFMLAAYCPCSLAADEAKTATLGADTRVPTADEARRYQLAKLVGRVQGQYVSTVETGGPAAEAGLKAGDLLLALDANKLYSRDDIEDFLRVSLPGAKANVLVKRIGTFKEESIPVTLGEAKAAGDNKQFTWQYAGLGQLDAALGTAKKNGKLLLVGLSGAET